MKPFNMVTVSLCIIRSTKSKEKFRENKDKLFENGTKNLQVRFHEISKYRFRNFLHPRIWYVNIYNFCKYYMYLKELHIYLKTEMAIGIYTLEFCVTDFT
jgi:hypothetical protein